MIASAQAAGDAPRAPRKLEHFAALDPETAHETLRYLRAKQQGGNHAHSDSCAGWYPRSDWRRLSDHSCVSLAHH